MRSFVLKSLWLLVLASGLLADVPELRTKTLENIRDTDQGITKPIIADRTGHKYVLKANVPAMLRGYEATKYGNFEAEIVAYKLFQLLGVRSPEVRVVKLEGKSELYLRIRFADEDFSHGQTAAAINKTSVAEADAVDLDRARAISIVDLLIGNPDRHEGNILLHRAAGGPWIPVPIDHNFALVTKAVTGVESWALAPIPGPDASDADVKACGDKYITFKHRNLITIRGAKGPEGAAGLKAAAAKLVAALSDAELTRIVRSIPPEAIVGRPAEERFAELVEVLRARRDAIPAFLERYLKIRD